MAMEDSTLHERFNLVVSVAVTLVGYFVDHKKDNVYIDPVHGTTLISAKRTQSDFNITLKTIKYSNIIHLGDVIAIKEK